MVYYISLVFEYIELLLFRKKKNQTRIRRLKKSSVCWCTSNCALGTEAEALPLVLLAADSRIHSHAGGHGEREREREREREGAAH